MEGNTRPFGELFAESTRNGLTRPKAVRGSGVKMVNMGELFAHPRLCNAPMDRVPLSQSEAERLLLEDGDLLFARQSLVLEGAGKCSIFLRDDEPVTFESHVTRVRLDQKKAHPGYYFYYLQSHQGRSAIRSIVEQGAGAAGIRASDLATLEVQWRTLPEQRAIAHILGTLDDKIELNRRMNETLEAMTRALFKSWFVDFDPVRAKMAGRDTGLPKHLADLFPDRLVESEVGEIPEGWEVMALDTIADFRNGLALQRYRPQTRYERLPVVKIAQLRSGKTDSGEWATSDICPEFIIDDGDVVFSWSGSLMVMVWCSGRAALNQHLFKVTSTRFLKWFFLHNVRSHLANFQTIAAGKATTMGHIKRHHLSDAMCTVPDSRLLAAADGPLSAIFERSLSANIQSRTLASLRDTLLPKLISGEIRLRDAERAVENI